MIILLLAQVKVYSKAIWASCSDLSIVWAFFDPTPACQGKFILVFSQCSVGNSQCAEGDSELAA